MPEDDHAKPLGTFDPNIKPKSSAEMEAEGEREQAVQKDAGHVSPLASEGGEDETSESAATLLPPD